MTKKNNGQTGLEPLSLSHGGLWFNPIGNRKKTCLTTINHQQIIPKVFLFKKVKIHFLNFGKIMTKNRASITRQIAKELNETRESSLIEILATVEILGADRCLEMVDTAKDMYAAGEMTRDGSRQRTLGGCYFIQVQEKKQVAKFVKEIKQQLEARREPRASCGNSP